jgi:uncharacterized protein
MNVADWLGTNTVYVVETGSHAYGTSTPESDFDYRGAAIPPKEYFYGFDNFEQADAKGTVNHVNMGLITRLPEDSDITIWALEKMIRLASDGNPNMIELLFADESNMIYVDKYVMEPFFDIRDCFLSKLLKHRFSGYAMRQLKRIRNHYRWLHNPPDYPTRERYGIEGVKFPKDQLGAAERVIDLLVEEWLVDQTHLPEDIKIVLGPQMIRMVNLVSEQLQIEASIDRLKDVLERAANRTLGFDSDFLNYLQRYKAYKNHLNDWNSYEKWKQDRNPARAKLEAEFHYDTKHSYHLVRLMRMAREILETGKVLVKRPDAEELIAIRNGAWKYEDLTEWAEKEDRALDQVMKDSALPNSPNRKRINKVLVEVTERFLYRGLRHDI